MSRAATMCDATSVPARPNPAHWKLISPTSTPSPAPRRKTLAVLASGAPPTEGVARQLELLTADGYAPTQAWPCSRDDAPIIKCVLDCMRAQAPKASTLHKIRAYLRGVYKLPVTVKSVPLRALLTAYPGNFVFLTATSLGERGQKIIAL